MGLEARFRIPEKITEAVMDEADSYEKTLEYAKRVLAKAKEKHPPLYRYLAKTAKKQGEFWYSYGISSALSYDILSRHIADQGIELDFSEDELNRHEAAADSIFDDPRWQNDEWVLERVNTKDGTSVDSGLGLFLNTVDAVAPKLAAYMTDFTNKIEPVNRRHTLRGFYDGFMPIYTKLRRLAEQS